MSETTGHGDHYSWDWSGAAADMSQDARTWIHAHGLHKVWVPFHNLGQAHIDGQGCAFLQWRSRRIARSRDRLQKVHVCLRCLWHVKMLQQAVREGHSSLDCVLQRIRLKERCAPSTQTRVRSVRRIPLREVERHGCHFSSFFQSLFIAVLDQLCKAWEAGAHS